MRTRPFLTLAALTVLGAGCATPDDVRTVTVMETAAETPTPPLSFSARSIERPTLDDETKPIEVKALVNEPGLKLVTIALRGGAVLPEHRTSSPVTIQAVSGSGVVLTADERLSLADGRVVVLAPGVPHRVEPVDGQDLVLLVHHLRHGMPPAH